MLHKLLSRKLVASFVLARQAEKMTTFVEYDIDLRQMRKPYRIINDAFREVDLVVQEPIGQFKEWFDAACKSPEIYEPNAVCLATATKSGIPSNRMVLLKGYGTNGFSFYTNYESKKGSDLKENPNAAMTFYWEPLKRQVRIEGRIEKVSVEESMAYFHSRPKDAQIAAFASQQSKPLISREQFSDKYELLKEQYNNSDVPKPECWGGYLLIPEAVEFWQGQSSRAHDRIKFRKLRDGEKVDEKTLHQGENGWVYERLSP